MSRLRAAFEAPYWNPPVAGLLVGNGGPGGSSAANEVRFRTQPAPRSRMPGTAAFMSSHGAQRLTCRFRSRSSGVTWSNGHVAVDRGVVHQDVDRTELGLGRRHEPRAGRRRVGQVDGQHEALASHLLDPPLSLLRARPPCER